MIRKMRTRRVKRARPFPLAQRVDVTRAEFNRLSTLVKENGAILNDLRHNQDIQLRRIAQMQAELDEISRAWQKLTTR